MATGNRGSGLSFIVGALVVAVVGLGFYAYNGGFEKQDADITIDLPDVDTQ
ncbi:hypothetical protein [Oceanicella sp. SM1341]|uniref:hypothetical protein n=1 Tax=Oceanicella sp. SM1341 TaxID=1548889 RepID=UPI0018E51B0E|nr:hypothetical protein [Oceanicella sp. SM1341]